MIDVDAWPLPLAAYRPGVNARPGDDDGFYRVAALAPAVTDADSWHDNAPYRFGFRLRAHGFFWEAHEVWEPVWMRARPNSRERMLLQGLIQLANAGLKASLGRPNAARRLAASAAAHFADARVPSGLPIMGLDPAACADLAHSLAFDKEIDSLSPSKMYYNAVL